MPSKENKKIVIITIAITLLIFLAIIITYIRTLTSQAKEITNPKGDSVLYAALKPNDNNLYYYSQKSNALMKWDLTTNDVLTWIPFDFQNTDNITYSPDLTQALVHTSNPTNTVDSDTWLVNLIDKKVINNFGNNVLTITWSPDGKKVAYQSYNWSTDANILAISDPNGQNQQKLLDVNFESMNIVWESQDKIVYYNLPSETAAVKINIVNPQTKAQSSLKTDYFSADAVAIPGQNKILIDLATIGSPTLQTLDLAQNKVSPIATKGSAGKTAISPDLSLAFTAYDQNEGLSSESDAFQIINLSTGKVSNLKVSSKQNLIAINLMVSPDNKILYFTSNGNLFKRHL